MKEIEIRKPKSQEVDYILIARLFATVFASPPWNELFAKNGRFYSRMLEGEDLALSWRKRGFERAYPLLNTAEYIRNELSRPDSIYVEIRNPNQQKQIAGFGWGFSYQSPEQLVNEKWSQASEIDKDTLINLIKENTGVNKLWYLSEVAVNLKLQNQGIGTKIVTSLTSQVPSLSIIMRTNAYSPMSVIAQKPTTSFQQIMGYETNRFINQSGNSIIQVNQQKIIGSIDPINPDRVLFFKTPE